MVKKLLKIIICAAMTGGCYFISRFLEVAPLFPVMFIGWGSFCFMFSFELSGSKTRVFNGIEQKTLLHLFWMLAGIISMCLSGGFLFYNM
jgi:hypothetical protein